ncbi:TNFAIP3-interacting protein 3 isoform X3 [Grammomys surdaster]|uniref:TNFAIP3-interacting protein 3 isoform X3 n=1 Tax=Grammomys surdaster TaxID=491861 RepID=UPI0010A0C284|nr:TNFAIP3-interacting protein 3 isoform X3 [Grammomys surdaster]
MAGLSAAGAYMEHTECAPPRRKDLTNSLEQKIKHLEKQRQELLDVNQQWDQQFRNMKELYERKKEKDILRKELQALKKENKLLKENNALANRKKEYYACEIKRLNKVLQDALTIGSSSFSEDSGKCKGRCSHAEMRTEVECHKQQTISGMLSTSFLHMYSTSHMVSPQKGSSTCRITLADKHRGLNSQL